MSWNYRIVQTNEDDLICYGIKEVYYNSDNKIKNTSLDYETVYKYKENYTHKEAIANLREDMELMMQAFEKPVLFWNEKAQEYMEFETFQNLKEDAALSQNILELQKAVKELTNLLKSDYPGKP